MYVYTAQGARQMPSPKRYREEAPRFDYDYQQWLIWNHETERWELPIEARWMECGEWLAINRVCTKLLGHEGEHGEREDAGTV